MNTRPMLTLEEEKKLLKWIEKISSNKKTDQEIASKKLQSLKKFLLNKPHYLNYRLPSYLGEPPLFEKLKNIPLCVQLIIEEESLQNAITAETWVTCFEISANSPAKSATEATLKYTVTGLYISAISRLPFDILSTKLVAPGQTALALLIKRALEICSFLITPELIAFIPSEVFNRDGAQSVAAQFLNTVEGLSYLGKHPEIYAAISDDVIHDCMHRCSLKFLFDLAAKHPYLYPKILQFFPVQLYCAIFDPHYHACVMGQLDRLTMLTTDNLFEQQAKAKHSIAVQLFTTQNGRELLLASGHLRSLITEEVLNLKVDGFEGIPNGTTIAEYLMIRKSGFAELLTLFRNEGKAGMIDKLTATRNPANPSPAKLFTPPPVLLNRVKVKSADDKNLKIKLN